MTVCIFHTFFAHISLAAFSHSLYFVVGDFSGHGMSPDLLSVHVQYLFIWNHVPLAARPFDRLEVGMSILGENTLPLQDHGVTLHSENAHSQAWTSMYAECVHY